MNLKELNQLKDKAKKDLSASGNIRIVVGLATCGIAAGAKPVYDAIADEVEKRNLKNVTVKQTGCAGMCRLEPLVDVYGADGSKVTYIKVDPEKARRIVAEHVVNGNICNEFIVGRE